MYIHNCPYSNPSLFAIERIYSTFVYVYVWWYRFIKYICIFSQWDARQYDPVVTLRQHMDGYFRSMVGNDMLCVQRLKRKIHWHFRNVNPGRLLSTYPNIHTTYTYSFVYHDIFISVILYIVTRRFLNLKLQVNTTCSSFLPAPDTLIVFFSDTFTENIIFFFQKICKKSLERIEIQNRRNKSFGNTYTL